MKVAYLGFLFPFMVVLNADASVEQKATEAFTREYVKEQIKHRVEIYLNQNPNVVGSVNPRVGTVGIQMVSKILAADNLMHAQSDKDRAWAASQLILSPEPTTALIIFAVHFADTMMTLRHEANLARIRQEIFELNAQTSKIMSAVQNSEISFQLGIHKKFSDTVDEIEKIRKSILDSRVFKQFDPNLKDSNPNLSEEDVAEIIQAVARLDSLFMMLERTSIYLDCCINLIDPKDIKNDLNLVNAYRPLGESTNKFGESFDLIFTLLKSEKELERINRNVSSYASGLNIDKRCLEVQSHATMDESTKRKYAQFLELCKKRFAKEKGEMK